MSKELQYVEATVLTQAVANIAAAAEVLERVGKSAQQSAKPAALRRGMSRTEAAQYLGVGTTSFDNMVKDGTMPKPVRLGGRVVWDIQALDAAFDRLVAPSTNNPWDA
jgi:predicted DNA-binding transcriptional regulator AlpA